MRRWAFLAAVAAAFASPPFAAAHGIGGIKDLPVPSWLFYYGGAMVLVLSFAALAALWRRPRLEGQAEVGRPLPDRAQRVLLSPWLAAFFRALSVAFFALVLAACFFGDESPLANLAPTFIWVIFWLGLVPVVVLLGNVWRVLDPWRGLADGAAFLARRAGWCSDPYPYPEVLGRWPAAVLLFLFAALELAYVTPGDPKTLGFAALLYSSLTWFGMLTFGREAWTRHGDAFSVYFELLSRLAPFVLRHSDGKSEIVLRRPLTGLTERDPLPGTLAFVAVMLGSVTFDGLSRTARWQDWYYEVVIAQASPTRAEQLGMALNLGGLVVAVIFVALTYLCAVKVARLLLGSDQPSPGLFVYSLVPIALAYAIAHYFSLFFYQGRWAIRLVSDPLGRGWDLFGTADFTTSSTTLSPNTIWYVQVAALVGGHVLGLVLAHDRAIAAFRSASAAVLTQYAMLSLMVLYTVGGLWLLSQG